MLCISEYVRGDLFIPSCFKILFKFCGVESLKSSFLPVGMAVMIDSDAIQTLYC